MRRFVASVVVLFLCLSLGAAELSFRGADAAPAWVVNAIERSARSSLIPRLGQGGSLIATLENTQGNSAKIVFQYGERSFEMDLAYGNLDEKELFQLLNQQLSYDGLQLIELPSGPYISYIQDKSALASAVLDLGSRFWFLDGEGRKRGSVLVSKVFPDEKQPFSLLSQTAGLSMLPGLSLVAQKPLNPGLCITLSQKLDIGLDAKITLQGAIPPFDITVSPGILVSGGDLANVHLLLGPEVEVPLSQMFGHRSSLFRNLGFSASALAGLGFAPSSKSVVYGGEFRLAISLRVQGFEFQLLGGNRIWTDGVNAYNQGLFLGLGTSYTW